LNVWTVNAVALIHAYDPEVVVFGGGVMQSADVILPFVEEYVENTHGRAGEYPGSARRSSVQTPRYWEQFHCCQKTSEPSKRTEELHGDSKLRRLASAQVQ
jgi:predicted NBD/HSP70 family sugar kinase